MDSSDTKDLEITARDWKYQYHQQVDYPEGQIYVTCVKHSRVMTQLSLLYQ